MPILDFFFFHGHAFYVLSYMFRNCSYIKPKPLLIRTLLLLNDTLFHISKLNPCLRGVCVALARSLQEGVTTTKTGRCVKHSLKRNTFISKLRLLSRVLIETFLNPCGDIPSWLVNKQAFGDFPYCHLFTFGMFQTGVLGSFHSFSCLSEVQPQMYCL